MKPQCNTSADCLRELARVMDQFEIEVPDGDVIPRKAVNSLYVKYCNRTPNFDDFPNFLEPQDWQFAIAEIEGKPVFPDSKVYYRGEEWLIRKYENASAVLLMRGNDMAVHCWVAISDLSWNPPKPATVMVELTVSQAELGAKLGLTTDIAQACKTALEKLK